MSHIAAPRIGGHLKQSQKPPPRSRTGCRTCRKRKVKCDETRPVCGKCRAVGRQCDFGIRYTWHTKNDLDKYDREGISRTGCPTWDPSAPALFPDPLLSSSPAIVPFSHTVKDEDREIWAASYPSGTFFVITNRSSYDHLPEYRQWQASAHTRAVSMPSLTTEGLRQAQSSVIRTAPPVLDSQSVFVPYFEETISPSPQSLSVSTQSDTSGLPNQWVQHASLYQAPAPQTSPIHSGFPALLNGHIGTQQDFGGAGAGGHSPFRFGSGQYQSDLTPFQPALSIDIPQQQQYAAHMEAIRSAPIPGQHGSSASFWPSLPPQRPFVDERPRTYTGEFIHATSAGYGGGGHSTGAYFTHSI